jgi:internalin A
MAIQQEWSIYTNWLKETISDQYSLLNTSAGESEFNTFEKEIGFAFPEELKELYSQNNGSKGFYFGLTFLPLEDVIKQLKSWEETRKEINSSHDDQCESVPEGKIKKMYSNPKWIPFIYDGGGNFIGLDLDPDEQGTIGQIINFGRDEDKKYILGKNLEEFLQVINKQIEEKNYYLFKSTVGNGVSIGKQNTHLIDALKSILYKE